MKLNAQILALLAGSMTLLMACKEDELIATPDPRVQRAIDLEIINDYIATQGYDVDPGDTTASGIRFVILDEGNGAPVEYGDIVDNYYVGRFTDQELFDTNIDTVDINNGTFDSLKTYQAQRFTHTETGWAIRQDYLAGYVDGITAVLERMNIGGKAEIIIPSGLAYGTSVSTTSPLRDAVLVFEIYPVYKR